MLAQRLLEASAHGGDLPLDLVDEHALNHHGDVGLALGVLGQALGLEQAGEVDLVDALNHHRRLVHVRVQIAEISQTELQHA